MLSFHGMGVSTTQAELSTDETIISAVALIILVNIVCISMTLVLENKHCVIIMCNRNHSNENPAGFGCFPALHQTVILTSVTL